MTDGTPSAARVDLNCDAGEGFGPWRMGDDETLIPLVTSVSIACGAHAGDPLVMRRTIELAAVAGEACAGRGYDAQGRLLERGAPGAVLTDAAPAGERALAMVHEGGVRLTDGAGLPLRADTLCIHGDTPGAAAVARAVRARLLA